MPATGLAAGAAEADRPLSRVLILGDSISAAYGMDLEQGWVSLLGRRLDDRDGGRQKDLPANDPPNRPGATEVINASISGDTSAGGLRRLPALLEKHRPLLLVIELGGNDGLRGYPTGKLRDNLVAMAALGHDSGAEVLILPMEIPPNYGPRYTSAFRQAFRDAAEASGAQLGPFILEHIATQPELMQADGIHPTAEAQALIADRLAPLVSRLLGGGA